MRSLSSYAVVSALTVLGLGCTPATQESSSEPAQIDNSAEARAAIEASNQKFRDAFRAGDASGLAALYTTDGQTLPPNVESVRGRETIAEFSQASFDGGLASIALFTVEVEGFGDTAFEVGRFTVSDSEGEPLDSGKYIVIWKVEDGEWRLHRDIWNSSQPAPAPQTEQEPTPE